MCVCVCVCVCVCECVMQYIYVMFCCLFVKLVKRSVPTLPRWDTALYKSTLLLLSLNCTTILRKTFVTLFILCFLTKGKAYSSNESVTEWIWWIHCTGRMNVNWINALPWCAWPPPQKKAMHLLNTEQNHFFHHSAFEYSVKKRKCSFLFYFKGASLPTMCFVKLLKR